MTIGENLDVNSKVAVKKIKEKLPRVKTEKTTPKNPATKSEASFSFVAEEKGRIKAKKELKKDDKFTVIKTIRTGKEIKKIAVYYEVEDIFSNKQGTKLIRCKGISGDGTVEEKVYDTEELKHLWKTDNLKFPYDEKSNFSQNLKKIDPERNKTILAKNKEAIKPKIIKKGGKLEEEKEATTIENETLPEKWERTSDFEELKKQFIENLKKFRGNSIFQNEQIELINKKPIEVLNNQIKFMEEELKKETEAEKKIEWQKKINKIKKIKKGLLEKNKEKKDKVKIETEKKIKTLKQLSQLWKKRRKKKKKRRK